MLTVEDLTVRFGATTAVDSVSFELMGDETLALLGPSGCGKSTLLRAIAGLQPIDGGRILLDDHDLAGAGPHERGVGLMFQDHALFPHRNVADNIAFGPRMQGIQPEARIERVAELLDLVGLPGFGARSVATLSGGEAQRVALARALAPRPRVLLLDEPLGSLDRSLRDRLVDELPGVLRAAGTAAIHVTHDHEEAFAVGDRLAVMTKGALRQTGEPERVWAQPTTAEVARFLGHINIIDGTDGLRVVRSDAAAVDEAGELAVIVIRSRFQGSDYDTLVRSGNGDELRLTLQERLVPGTEARLRLDETRVIALRE